MVSVRGKMEFEPLVADEVATIEPPTEEELTVLRAEVDPTGRTIRGEWMTLDKDTLQVARTGQPQEV